MIIQFIEIASQNTEKITFRHVWSAAVSTVIFRCSICIIQLWVCKYCANTYVTQDGS